ncbi:MAG: hypothetical protein WDM90_15725 [Ferruginibacter sp.]
MFSISRCGKAACITVGKYHLPKEKEKLGLDTLRPWDIDAEPEGTSPLHPFKTSDELINKSIECFTKLRPFFGDWLVKKRCRN